MSDVSRNNLSRRSFLFGTVAVGAGLTVGVYLTKRYRAGRVPVEWDPQAFVNIGSDNFVTVCCKHTEMGPGIYTGMATVVAEELDASWEQMRVEGAPANAELYSNLQSGEQMTGGSSSLAYSYEQLRMVGAATRQMLISAASISWKVPDTEITVNNGVVHHESSDRSSTFGDLAELAALQPVPDNVALKSAEQYKLIGRSLNRVDIDDKTNGTVRFTQDFRLPEMLTAVVAHAPRFGGILKSMDSEKAKAVSGVVDVVVIQTGVAVIATDFWAATKARELLSIEWDETNAFTLSSDDIEARYKTIAGTAGAVARDEGSITDSFADAHQIIQAEFEFPFLAHAPIEPLNCVVRLSEDKCEIWNAAQTQTRDQADAAKILGMAPEQIEVNMLLAGGAFGRRASKDYTVEAVQIAKALDFGIPLKLMWTREDDMRAGQYRPLNYHSLRAGINSKGDLIAWHHRLVGQSIALQESPTWVRDGVDFMSVRGASDWLYKVPNIKVETHSPELPIPVLWYRGVGSTHTVYAVETFIDEIATLTGHDALEYRLNMLQEQPRMSDVVRLVAEKANWGSTTGPGRGRGIEICKQRGTFLAQIADVSLQSDNSFSVDHVITAIDCGLTINPDVVRAQMEGGTGFGLSSTLGDEITFRDGYVEQSNFDTYRLLRINQMPIVDVHIVPSSEPPSGIGELATMTVGAAVANALYAATGERYHKLPIRLAG